MDAAGRKRCQAALGAGGHAGGLALLPYDVCNFDHPMDLTINVAPSGALHLVAANALGQRVVGHVWGSAPQGSAGVHYSLLHAGGEVQNYKVLGEEAFFVASHRALGAHYLEAPPVPGVCPAGQVLCGGTCFPTGGADSSCACYPHGLPMTGDGSTPECVIFDGAGAHCTSVEARVEAGEEL